MAKCMNPDKLKLGFFAEPANKKNELPFGIVVATVSHYTVYIILKHIENLFISVCVRYYVVLELVQGFTCGLMLLWLLFFLIFPSSGRDFNNIEKCLKMSVFSFFS